MTEYMSRHPMHLDTRNISEEYVNFLTLESLPRAIELDEVREASMTDKTIQMVSQFTRTGRWYLMKNLVPDSEISLEELTAIRSIRDELTVHSDNILLRDQRIVLPRSLRSRAVQVAHEGASRDGESFLAFQSMIPRNGWFSGENCERLCIMSVTYL